MQNAVKVGAATLHIALQTLPAQQCQAQALAQALQSAPCLTDWMTPDHSGLLDT